MTADRRNSIRFDAFCIVQVQSSEHGISHCVARNVSEGGVFLETRETLPLGTAIRVWFFAQDGAPRISAIGEVKRHYCLHYMRDDKPQSLTGMGVTFLEFEDRSDELVSTVLRRSAAPSSTSH
jgi:hypothetical protein